MSDFTDSGIPESWNCVDCGVNTGPGLKNRAECEEAGERFTVTFTGDSEVYQVTDWIWKKAGMTENGGCLCVGCLEKRIGHTLRTKDFVEHPFNSPHIPATQRLHDRRSKMKSYRQRVQLVEID